MRKAFSGIRAKLIAAMGLSAAAAVLVTYAMVMVAARLNDASSILRSLFDAVRGIVGETPIMLVTGLLIFIICFFLVTHRSVKRIEAIIKAVRQMEQGRLEARVDAPGADEIGEMAAAVNGMADKLSASLVEERRAEQAKRELIASMSHDLRTPLTSIIGFLELLTDRSGRPEPELERFAAVAHRKALRLQGLTDELFEYTRMGYGGIRLNRESININELLGQIAEEFYPVFEQAGMQCRLQIPDGRVIVTADGELLHRLMENLLNNAVKYGADGRFIDLRLSQAQGNAVIGVVNYGQAIPPEHLPNIFKRFYRAEQSRSRLTGGTGLGLAIAESIVELHGGAISATSDEKGTCFLVSLPMAQPAKAAGNA